MRSGVTRPRPPTGDTVAPVAPPAGDPTGWNPASGRWDHATLRRDTVHGVRSYNAGATTRHTTFEDEWYNYGSGTTESTFAHGMIYLAPAHTSSLTSRTDGMRSLFDTALQYLHGLPRDFVGVDVFEARTILTNALDGPAVLEGWRILLDGSHPGARDVDFQYAHRLD